jgi:hypothetical protein
LACLLCSHEEEHILKRVISQTMAEEETAAPSSQKSGDATAKTLTIDDAIGESRYS